MTPRLWALGALLISIAAFPLFSTLSWADAKFAEAVLSPTGQDAAHGTARFEETPDGLRLTLQIEKASPGPHAFHIHENGSCADSGKAAGDHFNPAKAPHGNVLESGVHGAHAGDFGNLQIGADGKGSVSIRIPGLTLDSGEFGVIGRAVVFHAGEDKFVQPSGDAGGRIACGVIGEAPAEKTAE